MNHDNYLPLGTTIAEKYEVVDFLGNDAFELLYLVRGVHRKGSFFVLKELFLETFSFREGQSVHNIPEAEGVFEKRKKQIIEEVGKLKHKANEIKVYGYEEDNNTIYTIMEFSNNASLEKYLQFIPKESSFLPSLDALVSEDKKGVNYLLFLKLITLMGVMAVIAFYAYQYFQKENPEEGLNKVEKLANMNPLRLKVRDETVVQKELEVEEKMSLSTEVNMSEINVETNITELKVPKLEEVGVIKEVNQNSIETRIKGFLDAYISASSGALVEDTLTYYADHVKRYFKLRNATHKVIARDQKEYNKKWVKRDFEIFDFEIIKSYQKEGVNFYDLKTTTLWRLTNRKSKNFSGKSRGFMTLKEVESGFKITTIYTLK